jgi:hypothetical protein
VHVNADDGQVSGPPHDPFWHVVPAAQTLPQPPQFAGSVIKLAQTLLTPPGIRHVACGGAQLPEPATQIAPVQVIPGMQA